LTVVTARNRPGSQPGAFDRSVAGVWGGSPSARPWVRLQVHEAADDFGLRALPRDRLDGQVEGRVVEHAAVDEPGVLGALTVLVVAVAEVRRDAREVDDGAGRTVLQPAEQPTLLRKLAPEGLDAHGREGPGEARRRTCGEREHRRVGARERRAVVVRVPELQHLRVEPVALTGATRAGGHQNLEAVQVRRRHEQVERAVGRHQSAVRRVRVHRTERLHEQLRHALAAQRRRRRERHRDGTQRREQGLHLQPGEPGGAQQRAQVALVDPELLQAVLRTPAGDRLAEHDAVDAAGGRAGDDVDRDGEPATVPGEVAQRLEVRVLAVRRVRRGRRERVRRFDVDSVERTGRLHELVQLLGDPMHVDREGDASVADEREP
jgi:hypothetical protein